MKSLLDEYKRWKHEVYTEAGCVARYTGTILSHNDEEVEFQWSDLKNNKIERFSLREFYSDFQPIYENTK